MGIIMNSPYRGEQSTHLPAPRRSARAVSGGIPAHELLVADARADLTPADLVERKLAHLLKGAPPAIRDTRTGLLRDHPRPTS